MYIIGKNEISTDIRLESCFYLELLITDQSFLFPNSCIDYLESNLPVFLFDKEKEMQMRIKEIVKCYIKIRGFKNCVDMLNELLNYLGAEACFKKCQQSVIEILNYILENFNEASNKNTNDLVKN